MESTSATRPGQICAVADKRYRTATTNSLEHPRQRSAVRVDETPQFGEQPTNLRTRAFAKTLTRLSSRSPRELTVSGSRRDVANHRVHLVERLGLLALKSFPLDWQLAPPCVRCRRGRERRERVSGRSVAVDRHERLFELRFSSVAPAAPRSVVAPRTSRRRRGRLLADDITHRPSTQTRRSRRRNGRCRHSTVSYVRARSAQFLRLRSGMSLTKPFRGRSPLRPAPSTRFSTGCVRFESRGARAGRPPSSSLIGSMRPTSSGIAAEQFTARRVPETVMAST